MASIQISMIQPDVARTWLLKSLAAWHHPGMDISPVLRNPD
jgi:hypothetical protein